MRANELYSCFAMGPMKPTTARVAELSKLVENAYRDVNVAFANELSLVCDALGIDVWSVIRIANLHPRVNILSPGPGVGGHCIPVDPWFIHQALPERTPLIKAAREVNDGKPLFRRRPDRQARQALPPAGDRAARTVLQAERR